MMNFYPIVPDEEVYTEDQMNPEPALTDGEAARTDQPVVTRTLPLLPGLRQLHVLPDLEVNDMAEFAPYSKQPYNSAEETVDACERRGCFQDDQSLEKHHYSVDSSSHGMTDSPTHTVPGQEFRHSKQTPRTICSSVEEKNSRNLCENEKVATPVEASRDEEMGSGGATYNNSTLGENVYNMQKEQMNNRVDREVSRDECQPGVAVNELPSPFITPTEGSKDLSKESGSDPLGPRICSDRVIKSSRTGSGGRSHESHTVPPPSRVPTEEDLLLLLMRRQRIRGEAHDRLLANFHQLQGENQRLKRAGIEQARKVESAEERWQEAFRKGNVLEAEVKHFKEKYNKLKLWAQEIHKEYASIRAEGTRLSEEISDLKAERQVQVDTNTQVLRDLESISRPVQKLKDVIAELQDTSVELRTTRDSLQRARAELEDAKLQNKTHSLHIAELEGNQRSINSKFLEGQNDIRTEIAQVSGQIQKHDTNTLQKTMNEVMHVIREIQKNGSTKVEISTHFHSLMSNAEERFSKLSTAVASIAQTHAEHHTMQELNKTLNKLKAEHAVDMAKRTTQIQHKADEKVVASEMRLKETQDEYQNIHREKTEAETKLADLQLKFSATQMKLAADHGEMVRLESEKQELSDQLQAKTTSLEELTKRLAQLESSKQKLEVARNGLQAGMSVCEAERKRWKHDFDTSQQKLDVLQARFSDLKTMNDNNEAAAAQLAAANEEATKKDEKIAELEEMVQSGKASLTKLNEQLELATNSASEVPDLKEEIRQQNEELKQLKHDLTNTRTNYAAVEATLSTQKQLVQRLESEKTKISDDLEVLASSHEQCGGKNQETHDLKERISDFEKERAPLSTLMNLLTDNGKLALTREVVLQLKDVILEGDLCSGNFAASGEGIFVKPKRAADRSGQTRIDEVVVQDSQEAGHVALSRSQSNTSELSEPPGDLNNLYTQDSDYPIPSGFSTMVKDAFAAGSPESRPGTSNHEMLLRSSDVGGYAYTSQFHATVQVPASAPEFSPMRTRAGSQIRHGTPTPQTGADGEHVVNFMTPPSYARENHVPNSAAKRRQVSEAPEASAKRRNVTMKDLEAHPTRNIMASSSTQTSDVDRPVERPAVSRTTVFGATMPIPGKTKKNTNSTRKTTKSAKMQAQFNSGVN